MTAAEIDAMPAGSEMDGLIACACGTCGEERMSEFHPSTNVNHAMSAAMSADWFGIGVSVEYEPLTTGDFFWHAKIRKSAKRYFRASAYTPALAICRALLKAVL